MVHGTVSVSAATYKAFAYKDCSDDRWYCHLWLAGSTKPAFLTLRQNSSLRPFFMMYHLLIGIHDEW